MHKQKVCAYPNRTCSAARAVTAGTRSAFTLIELLVVIAIIAILASILVPAVTNALHTARRTLCAAQMHDMGLAIQQYLGDYENYLPNNNAMPSPLGETRQTFDKALMPYMGIDVEVPPAAQAILNTDHPAELFGVFHCPDDGYTRVSSKYIPRSYIMRMWARNWNKGSFPALPNNTAVPLDVVDRPSYAMLVVEGHAYNNALGNSSYTIYPKPVDRPNAATTINDADPEWLHNGDNNSLYADAHVAPVPGWTWAAVRTWSYLYWPDLPQ